MFFQFKLIGILKKVENFFFCSKHKQKVDKILFLTKKEQNMSRVSTYLNFSRNTQEPFNFYKSLFGAEFGGNGIARFGDIPASEGMLQIPAADKNLIMHIELPTIGGNVLMGTDAPESIGFTVNF